MITARSFGTCDAGNVTAITISNKKGMSVTVLSLGGILQKIVVPDKNGNPTDVCLGYETLEEYLRGGCVGAVIGRYANRLSNAKFSIDGVEYKVTANMGIHQIHGGKENFMKKNWEYEYASGFSNEFKLRYVSPDGEEGFPGTLTTELIYKLDEDNGLVLDYVASSDKDTIYNITNHCYFNLSGQGSGTIRDHLIQMNASHYTPTDKKTNIPTGEIAPVAGTVLDFTTMKRVGDGLDDAALAPYGGYDHNFACDGEGMRQIAKCVSPLTGISMTTETTLEGVQVYTSNFVHDHKAKEGKTYTKHAGICFETQHYPDAANRPEFPSSILRAGDVFHETTRYRFGVEK